MSKTYFSRKDSGIELDDKYEATNFFSLPPEIRTQIYNLIFDPSESRTLAFHKPNAPDSLNENYYASDRLAPLLTNRQFHTDAHLLAFSRTTFVVRNPFTAKAIPARLTSRLSPQQIASIRSLAYIAEADHFRQMRNWRTHAFGMPALRLETLHILLYRSSYWHYLFDFNTTVVELLRDLRGVDRITYLRNESRVKPHFHTWFNRLCGAVLKRDWQERFATADGVPNPEKVWWEWSFDHGAQTASLVAVRPKRLDLDLGAYHEVMAPVEDALLESLAAEEFDPDPRSRNG